LGLSR